MSTRGFSPEFVRWGIFNPSAGDRWAVMDDGGEIVRIGAGDRALFTRLDLAEATQRVRAGTHVERVRLVGETIERMPRGGST